MTDHVTWFKLWMHCMTTGHRLLWEIRPPTDVAPSYLFGTMHVKDHQAFRGFERILTYVERCATFAAEFNFEEVDSAQFTRMAALRPNQQVQEHLSPSVYRKLDRVVQRELGAPLKAFHQLSPMLLINQLSEAQLGSERPQALDQALHEHALTHQKTILGLETFEEQLAVFKQINLPEQYRTLKLIATHFKRFRRSIHAATAAYIKGDIRLLLRQSQRSIGSMRRPLLYDRNQRMAIRFATFSQEQSLFGAVGAAHLAGEKGVLRLLKLQGFHLRPVPYLDL